jgi:sigma-E factor negative regulatory protein RseA
MVTDGRHNVESVDIGQSLSALMDGELEGEHAGREIARLKADVPAREFWDNSHLIGDAMRGGALSAASVSTFGRRFSELLAQEPTVLAPVTNLANVGSVRDISADFSSSAPRVTPRKWQTYAMSAAASVAAVAVVGWAALNMLQPDTPATPAGATGGLATAPVAVQPQPEAIPPAATALQAQPAALAAAEPVQEYLWAHQGVSPTTAIQGVTPYVRTVSSTGE